ncbi:MAG: ATP-binding cassette domain-containing protein [Clostridiales bacterium]|jgi:oligopeptide/dipeptide ABC transporter, ATP-binding protein, C-terminal domain|nr:ATP-binding cassette domain-containing protein [Clostridiales bacterium]MCI6955464.1 ATP-binding cassette domain-containing protein [Clostridiales bacterium]MDY5630712.1 oligopeptide/dipeptide ABC transporter ATP-binding protein [Eubacteriales bacterium]
MNTSKKLLSINNLKKYFPIAKSSIFQKEQLYVKANEDISLDIYEGETIGVVGESGCGKSTLGRVLLQLYPQTAGESIYYGRSIAEVAPAYIRETIVHFDRHLKKYEKLRAKAEKLEQEVAAVGEEQADFFLLQNRNLAEANAQTELQHIVKIVGGFFAVRDQDGLRKNLEIYKCNIKDVKLKRKFDTQKVQLEYLEGKVQEEGLSDARRTFYNKRIERIRTMHETTEKAIVVEDERFNKLCGELDEIKARYSDNEEFQKYEAMLDNGVDLARLKYKEIRPLRHDLQIIFQDPYSSLNPRMTVGQIIEEGLTTHNFFRHGSKAMKEYILQTMSKCGLQDYMLHRYPHQFSGGQRQRICIARALAVKPKFVVCDECVSALDVSIQSQIINLLEELKEKEGLTYLFISHDLSVVRYISDRICVMYLGNIVELADAETIFKDPRHPYTIALLSSIPTTDIESLEKERILLEGSIPSPIKPPSGCKFHTRCYMACDKCNRVPPPLVEVEPGHFVACHKLEKKLDEEGNYLFEMPKMVKKTAKIQEVKSEEGEESLPADVVEEQINAEADQNETDAIIAEDIAKKSMD